MPPLPDARSPGNTRPDHSARKSELSRVSLGVGTEEVVQEIPITAQAMVPASGMASMRPRENSWRCSSGVRTVDMAVRVWFPGCTARPPAKCHERRCHAPVIMTAR